MSAIDILNIIFLSLSSLAILIAGLYWLSFLIAKLVKEKEEIKWKQIMLNTYGEQINTDDIKKFKSISGDPYLISNDNVVIKYDVIVIANIIRIIRLYKRDINLIESIKTCLERNKGEQIKYPYQYYYERNDHPSGVVSDASNDLTWKIYKFDYLNNSIIFSKYVGVKFDKDTNIWSNKTELRSLRLPNGTYKVKTKTKKQTLSNKLTAYNTIKKIEILKLSDIFSNPLNYSDDKIFIKDAEEWLKYLGFCKE